MARQKPANLPAGPAPGDLAPRTLILDNGAYTLKAGFALSSEDPIIASSSSSTSYHLIPNVIAHSPRDRRTYIGPELNLHCRDFGALKLRRPVEKGYIVNWEGQKAIWEKTFFEREGVGELFVGEAGETNLILTEAPNAPAALQRNSDEMCFEEFGFGAVWRGIAPVLNAYAPSPFHTANAIPAGQPLECLLVVDAGHSHTTITPLHRGRPIPAACRRLEIGGKTLSNHLKTLISRGAVNLSHEDWIVNQLKEDVCYTAPSSKEFGEKLEGCWKGGRYDAREIDRSLVVDYVLPDYDTLHRGVVREYDPLRVRKGLPVIGLGGRKEHVVTLGNERFVPPELLFTPSDIGIPSEGIAGCIVQSLAAIPYTALRQAFLANILVVGGTSHLPGFVERLEAELRMLVDELWPVRVVRADDPVGNVWKGGEALGKERGTLAKWVVTKGEYEEHGDVWTRRRFAGKVGR